MATYEQYKKHLIKIADLKNALAVLQWDQEIYLPLKGAGLRGQQMATLSEQVHLLSTEEQFGNILQDLLKKDILTAFEKKNVELSWEDYSKQKRYSADFVRLLSETISRSFHSWIEARKLRSFERFEKDLDELIKLKRQETGILGYQAHPYNALLNEHEKGCTIA
ncbi:MAG TPA: hypothetical protein VK543_09310, partial [Puia sp.]|nr:hypothetical protein [Puia sp.]